MAICENTAPPFHDLALQYLDGLYGYALSLTRNRDDAEDLVQETYLRAARAHGELKPESNLKGWMYTVLRNLWFTRCRSKRSHAVATEIDENTITDSLTSETQEDDPFLTYVNKRRTADIKTAMSLLPGKHREILILRVFEELSYEELSNILHIPRGTVMSRLARARSNLKKILEKGAVHF